MTATQQQRTTANEIWSELDVLVIEVQANGSDVSALDFYAVWGLAHAILESRYDGEDAIAHWMNRLYDVWGEVSEKYRA